jgi:ADP-ribose pyrophosphatase YjhB (NUDIX family)
MTKLTVGIIVVEGNKVLLVRNEKNSGYNDLAYGLPAGRVEENESEITAAARELKEETGLTASEKDLKEFPGNLFFAKLKNRQSAQEREIEYQWRVYFCEKYSGEISPSTETTPEWIELEKLDSLNLIVNVKEAIERGIKNVKRESENLRFPFKEF